MKTNLETKNKSKIGSIHTTEHNEKISKANLGRTSYWDGKNLSNDTKEKMSSTRKLNAKTDQGKEHIKNYKKLVLQKEEHQ